MKTHITQTTQQWTQITGTSVDYGTVVSASDLGSCRD